MCERDRETERERERGGWAEAENFQADSLLSTEPNSGLDPRNEKIMTWAETQQLSHPDAPSRVALNEKKLKLDQS